MFQHISNTEFEAGIGENERAVILDVRTPEEWEEGIIPGAVKLNIMSPEFAREITKFDKSKAYYVYCRSGARSANACGYMESLGFKELYNLKGGILGWHGAVEQG